MLPKGLCLRVAWLLAGGAGRLGARWPQRRPGGRERGNHNASVLGRKAGSGNWQGRADPRTPPERRQSAPSTGPENAARRQPERFRCVETVQNHCDFRALRLRRKKCLENIRNSMQQPRPGAEGAPRAAAHVLFMWAPGGGFSRREVFWYLRFWHSTSFPSSQLTLETK